MDTRTFLQDVVAGVGHYCLFAYSDTKGRKQRFFTDMDDLLHASAQLDAQGFNTFFALATFVEDGSRKADNVHTLRSFFLDIDCGEGKDYATKKDGIQALTKFCKTVGLPTPYMVDSGNGVHAYWPIAEDMELEQWTQGAERLKKACEENEFYPDPAITADAARVLRVPGTHNYKGEDPKDVVLLNSGKPKVAPYSKFISKLPMVFTKPANLDSRLGAVMEKLLGNKRSKFKTILKKTAKGEGCAQIGYAVTHQGDVSEPMWRATLSIAQHCKDAKKAIHFVSEKHPQYDPGETADKASRTKGPYLCDKFNEYRPGVCTECPHWNKIKSPIVLGQYIEEATEKTIVHESNDDGGEEKEFEIPLYPKPFFRGAVGGVYIRVKPPEPDEPPEDFCVYHNDLYVVRRLKDAEWGEVLVWRLHLPKDGVREFTIPLAACTSREELRKAMSAEGVPLYGKAMDHLMHYTAAWVNELQAQGKAAEARRHFGWSNDEDYESFLLGDKEIFRDRIDQNPPSSATSWFFPAFRARGTLQEWREIMAFYERPDMELHQFMIGCSFGSPLMAFMTTNSLLFNVFSEGSGLGKTTTMLAGASIWGNPALLTQSFSDTGNSRMNRAELHSNIPLFIDELTNTTALEISTMAYQFSGGRQKNRMAGGTNAERVRSDTPWRMIALTTANASLLEIISGVKNAPKAEGNRILEAEAHKVMFGSKEETDRFAAKIQRNFGHAGVKYMAFVVKNQEKVREKLLEMQRRIDKKAGFDSENRFYSNGIACALTGLLISNKLGFTNFDLKKLETWVVNDLLRTNMSNINKLEQSTSQRLSDFLLGENYGSILRIKSTMDGRSSGVEALDNLVVADKNPNVKLVARYETDTHMLYLMHQPLKMWCIKNQINYASFCKALQREYQAEDKKVRLTKGTKLSLPPTQCWVLKFEPDQLLEDGEQQAT